MATVSVVLAVLNEEENLPLCLGSVKDIADEIIVVDGGSTDRTIEIAKKYGAKVTITDNPPIFHVNKQKAIDRATKDWILQLDADERLTPELAKEMKNAISSKTTLIRHSGERRDAPDGASRSDSRISKRDGRFWTSQNDEKTINGYWIPRKNWFLGRFLMKGGQYPDYTLRLYRRGYGHLPQKDVHEQAVVEGKVGYLNNPLIHMADLNFYRYLIRFDRYTSLIKDELKRKKIGYNPIVGIKYMLVLPVWWFLLTYIRHKGFIDSWQGFIFSFFSALRFPVGYIKYIRKHG